MSESTRPSGAPGSGDGGIDGHRPPVPPPSDGGRRGHAALFDALLRDRRDEQFLRVALRRRVELRVPHGLLLLCGVDGDPAAVARAVAGRLPRAVAVAADDAAPRHAVVVVPVPAQRFWPDAVGVAGLEARARSGLVVARTPVVGLRALRASYFAALSDAEIAVAIDLPGPLVADADLVVPRMLAALPAEDQQVLLAPLRPILDMAPDHRESYVRTLDALHHHGGNCARAAEQLHVHANTVRYRMGRIEELTGLRLDHPQDRLRVDLAAMLVRLRGCPPSHRGDAFLQDLRYPEPPLYVVLAA